MWLKKKKLPVPDDVKRVPRATLAQMFPRDPFVFWDTEVCPHPDGNTPTYVNQDVKGIDWMRQKCNEKNFEAHKNCLYPRFVAAGAERILENLKKQFDGRINPKLYRAYIPQGYIFPPVRERVESGYTNSSWHKKLFHFIVEDQTTTSILQPSSRPVFLMKFSFLEDDPSNAWCDYEEDRPFHAISMQWEHEQAFETLFDIIAIDPVKKRALHWQRTPEGKFLIKANKVGPHDKIHLLGLDMDISMPEILALEPPANDYLFYAGP
jgi:hypothetical protein